MNLFYATDIRDGLIYLGEEEAHHAVQVMRRRSGDELAVVDGRGGFYRGVIAETGKKRCVARILEEVQEFGRRPFRLHLAVAPTKNTDRFEWLLEKATEIGVDIVTPLLCEHSERRQLRVDRLEKVLVSAMKQSLKAYLPILEEPTPFSAFIRRPGLAPCRYIAYLGEQTKGHLKDNYRAGQDVTVLIGPEGDFSPAEIGQALEAGFEGVTLGASRLRTETAGVVACCVVNLLNET